MAGGEETWLAVVLSNILLPAGPDVPCQELSSSSRTQMSSALLVPAPHSTEGSPLAMLPVFMAGEEGTCGYGPGATHPAHTSH